MIAAFIALALLSDGSQTPSATSTSSPVIQKPHWLRRPSGQDMARVYPRIALRKEIGGRTVLACRILANGRLNECRVDSETPAGKGFAEASLKLAPYFQMTTKTADGQSVEGGVIIIPLVWSPPRS